MMTIDARWKEHLLALDHLKEGIGLRGYAQRDPLMEYKRESFDLFSSMRDSIQDDVLRALYSLSPAESELVQLLSTGHSLDEAARLRDVTINTVRTQLKRVFAKTQTSGQADLVQMVLTGVAAVHED